MIVIFFAVLGVLSGVLLNRAADNLPSAARRSFRATPHCPFCDSPRTLLEQSGILSFVLRRDRCHNCGALFPLRAPLVEIAAGGAFAFLATRNPLGMYLVVVCFFTAVLLLIAVTDIEHKLILNIVTLPASVLAVLASPILLGGENGSPTNWSPDAVLLSLGGAAVGYLITGGIYLLGVLFLKGVNRGRNDKINTVAFGMGDVKLAGLLGALIGFPAIFYALLYAILLGGIGAIVAIFLRSARRRGYSAFMAIPYGPYLIVSGWAFLVFGPELARWIYGG